MPTTLDARPAAMAAVDRESTKVRMASMASVASPACKPNRRGALTNPGSRQTHRSPVSGSRPDSNRRKIRLWSSRRPRRRSLLPASNTLAIRPRRKLRRPEPAEGRPPKVTRYRFRTQSSQTRAQEVGRMCCTKPVTPGNTTRWPLGNRSAAPRKSPSTSSRRLDAASTSTGV